IYLLQRNINQTVTQGIDSLKRVYENYPTYTNEERRVHVELSQKTEDSFYYAQQILHNVAIVNQRAKRVNIDKVIHYIDQYGYYRFCAFGIFTLVLCWLAAGFHLGISVVAVVKYYVHCDPTEESPFAKVTSYLPSWPGMAFLLLSAVITGLFFTVLVLLASKAWRHFTRGYHVAGLGCPLSSSTACRCQHCIDDALLSCLLSSEKYSEYVYNTEERVPLQNVEDGAHYRYM
ncbi:hypothetical protein LSH36_715g01052, partial [Paralvinella palmiformis]